MLLKQPENCRSDMSLLGEEDFTGVFFWDLHKCFPNDTHKKGTVPYKLRLVVVFGLVFTYFNTCYLPLKKSKNSY
jgi:hypothetical protein